eukprot:EC685537.1.p4 GENE.EC685537.1~~EC685537.1.p4  ORF type:complete len:137 (+),score=45.53 EC685537.1:90-500(+)
MTATTNAILPLASAVLHRCIRCEYTHTYTHWERCGHTEALKLALVVCARAICVSMERASCSTSATVTLLSRDGVRVALRSSCVAASAYLRDAFDLMPSPRDCDAANDANGDEADTIPVPNVDGSVLFDAGAMDGGR